MLPFGQVFWDMIKLNLNRKHLSLEYNATLISFGVAMLNSTFQLFSLQPLSFI